LTVEVHRHLGEGEGGFADAPGMPTLMARFDGSGRRGEVERFVRDVGGLIAPARQDFAIAMHPVQVNSKLWLIDELARRRQLSRASLLVLGAWYGVLPLLMNWRLTTPPPKMLCIDLDEAACKIGSELIGGLYGNVEYRCADLTELDYANGAGGSGNVVINTSCEHVPELADWWAHLPPGQLAVLQSNNYHGCPDHVNCVHSLDEFKRQTPMSHLLFAGRLEVAHDLTRFMLIGRR
jgi:hypothetical protein